MKKVGKLCVALFFSAAYAYDTVHQAAHEFKHVIQQGHDVSAQVQAAHIVQEAFNAFYVDHNAIVMSMVNRYFSVFHESPFGMSAEKTADNRVAELERCYVAACETIKMLEQQKKELEFMVAQEKDAREKLYQEVASLQSATTQGNHAGHYDDTQSELRDIYEQLREASEQYGRELGSGYVQKTHARDGVSGNELRKEDVRMMLKQWDAIMHQLRILNQKAEAYEIIKETHKQCEHDIRQVTEQRDGLERQLRDLHRKFDNEQSKHAIALNDVRSQLEAARNQLAETKNQLALARKQQPNAAPKNQDLEKLLQSERLAYEGALSDERMQRQKLRQQVQDLQKRLETERASYEKRVMALEQEVVMLIERLPAGQQVKRTGSVLTKHEVAKDDTQHKEERRRI